jgi:hypothetical protein
MYIIFGVVFLKLLMTIQENASSLEIWTTKESFDWWQGRVVFLYSVMSRLALGPTQPAVKWVVGVLSPVIKQSGHEADHPSSSSAEV